MGSLSKMHDDTESIRRAMIATGEPQRDLAENEARNPSVPADGYADGGEPYTPAELDRWSTAELQRDFEVIGFAAPFVVVKRKSDGVKGSLEFTHSPRVYFNWRAD